MIDPITYVLDGSTAVVTLDDGKANALSGAAIGALLSAIARAEQEAKALVLAGRPQRFCAGFDLKTMMGGADAATGLLRHGTELFLKLYGTPLPLVIACTGHAMAGGALVLLTGDLRVGAAGPFRIGLNEVSIGMPLPVLGIELARDRLAAAELPRATLTAHVYDPEGAARAGFLDEVVGADEVLPRAKAEAARLGALSRAAYGATKARLRGQTLAHIRESLDADLADLMALLSQIGG